MTLTVANLGASANPDINDSTDLTAYANTAWTPSGDIVFVFVYNRVAAGTANGPTVTGNSLSWSLISTVASGLHRISLVAAPAAGGTNGATTIDFSAQTQTVCTALFAKATDVELAGGISSAFVQFPTGSGGSGTASSVVLASASAAGNMMVSGVGHQANEATTPSGTWTELDDLAGAAPIHGVESQVRNGGATSNHSATWATSSAWVGVAAEIAETLPVGPAAGIKRRVGRPQAAQRASRW